MPSSEPSSGSSLGSTLLTFGAIAAAFVLGREDGRKEGREQQEDLRQALRDTLRERTQDNLNNAFSRARDAAHDPSFLAAQKLTDIVLEEGASQTDYAACNDTIIYFIAKGGLAIPFSARVQDGTQAMRGVMCIDTASASIPVVNLRPKGP